MAEQIVTWAPPNLKRLIMGSSVVDVPRSTIILGAAAIGAFVGHQIGGGYGAAAGAVVGASVGVIATQKVKRMIIRIDRNGRITIDYEFE